MKIKRMFNVSVLSLEFANYFDELKWTNLEKERVNGQLNSQFTVGIYGKVGQL